MLQHIEPSQLNTEIFVHDGGGVGGDMVLLNRAYQLENVHSHYPAHVIRLRDAQSNAGAITMKK